MAELVSYSSIDHETREDYDAETTITTTYNYYIVNFDKAYSGEEDAYFEGDPLSEGMSLEGVLDAYIDSVEGGEGLVRIKVSENLVMQPSTLHIALGALAGVALAAFYLAFRYASHALLPPLASAPSLRLRRLVSSSSREFHDALSLWSFLSSLCLASCLL
jgi:hypothetical protein